MHFVILICLKKTVWTLGDAGRGVFVGSQASFGELRGDKFFGGFAQVSGRDQGLNASPHAERALRRKKKDPTKRYGKLCASENSQAMSSLEYFDKDYVVDRGVSFTLRSEKLSIITLALPFQSASLLYRRLRCSRSALSPTWLFF